jgi:hypothetical protein
MTQQPLNPQDEGGPVTGPTRRLSEDEIQGASQQPDTNWSDVGQDWKVVGEEFKKLGTRISAAIRGGWKSDQEHDLNNLQDQLRAMVDQVESAVRSARQEAQSPETRAQTQRVVEAARGAQSRLVEEVRDTVAAGLRTLNTQLRELADRIETGRKQS